MKRLAALAFALLAPLLASAQYNSYIHYAAGTAPSYEGLWWNPSESGWGLSVAHQGDVIFAVWYTFDHDGSPTWFAMPDARLMGEDMGDMTGMGDMEMMMGMSINSPTFTGALYRPSMVNGRLVMTEVGMGTILFKAREQAVFLYNVGNSSGERIVSKMIYSSEPQTCTLGGAKGATENYQDLWFDPLNSGWGVNFAHQGNTLFGTYYSYDDAGRPVWYAMPETRQIQPPDGSAAAFAGPIVRATGPAFDAPWDASKVRIEVMGTASVLFNSRGLGAVWTVIDSLSRPARPITRMQFAAPASVCH